MRALVVAFILMMSSSASASSIVEDLSSTTYLGTGTLVWNIVQKTIHPTLQVTGWNAGGGAQTTDILVGDGRDGEFKTETLSRFGTVSGNTITIDASGGKILQVTSFRLDALYTLTAINGPLIIYSQSTVEILGTIDCAGTAGSGTTPGIGKCGGGNGGAGGSAGASGEQGYPRTGSFRGGFGGTYNGVASGAGGGGGGSARANGNSGANDNSATNTGGAFGTGTANHQFTTLDGSGGGGGGSGSAVNSGGGGGGGGGTVIIHAVGDITVSGLIDARGGAGANSTANPNGGGSGGGGGGGGIRLASAGQITLQAGVPANANFGSAGTKADANAGLGGNGADGRTWLTYSTFGGAGSESPTTGLAPEGTFQYANAVEQQLTTKGYDTRSTMADFQSFSVSPSVGGLSVMIAGSNDNFASDDSGWLTSAQVAQIKNKRYVRFLVKLTNGNPTTPIKATGFTVTYNAPNKEEFNFKSSCGSVGNVLPPSNGMLSLLLSLLFLPFALGLSLRRLSKPIKA